MRERSCVLLDLDGTLVQSLPAMQRVYFSFLAGFSVKGTQKEFDSLNGPSIREIAAILKRRHALPGTPRRLAARYLSAVKSAYGREVKAYPDSKKAFRYLASIGTRVSLVTSAFSEVARPFVAKNRWQRRFSAMTFGDEVRKGKPDPEIYRRAIAKIRVKPSAVLVVEDSVHGVTSAKAAGAYVVGVSRGSARGREALGRAGADATISSMHDLKELLPRGKHAILLRGKRFRVRREGGFSKRGQDATFEFSRFDLDGADARAVGRFASYRTKGRVLAVSGVSFCVKKGRKFFLVGLRSARVGAYKRHWELVPSGGLDLSCVGRGGSVDYLKKLRQELNEEAGIPPTALDSVRYLGVVQEPRGKIYDIACKIRLRTAVLDQPLRFRRAEYSRMFFLETKKVAKLLDSRNAVPASKTIFNFIHRKERVL